MRRASIPAAVVRVFRNGSLLRSVHACSAMERMRKVVYAFYNEDFSFAKLVKRHPHLRPCLTDLLIGDLFIDQFDELFAAIEEICELPESLDYGFETLAS